MEEVRRLKEEGNLAFKEKRFPDAIESYSKAILFDDTNHLLYSNRSMAHFHFGKFKESLKDAKRSIELNPKWSKVKKRKGR